jgi:inner membrane protein
LLARATARKDAAPLSLPRRMAAGFFACAAPDLDFVVGFVGPVEYLLHHRGVTHSVLVAPLWALPLAWVLAKILRAPGGWRELYTVCLTCLLLHIAGDWITSFGTMVFAPFSTLRAGIGATFIIDLWFSGIILAGLAASALWRRSRVPAILATALLAGYVCWQWTLKQEALAFARGYAESRGMQGAELRAYPRAVSSYNWTVMVSDARRHHLAHVNLRRERPRFFRPGDGFVAMLDAPFQPLAEARWETRERYGPGEAGRAAFEAPPFAFFRWFADAPAYEQSTDGGACHWFADLRFLNPGRDWLPFRFAVCKEDARSAPGGPWRIMERTDEGASRVVR